MRTADTRLLIVDDHFPHRGSGFRLQEFHAYLETFPNAIVAVPGNRPGFEQDRREYERDFPHFRGRLKAIEETDVAEVDIAYLLFLNNAFSALPLLEQTQTPFLWTLYPGGGFLLGEQASDAKLAAVLTSPQCAGVITTQRTTERYVRTSGLIDDALIHHIQGSVVDAATRGPLGPRTWFDGGDSTFDVMFAAHRYTHGGVDKGYDLFIAAAHQLAPLDPRFRFHVVGPWTAADAPISGIEKVLTFHGELTAAELRDRVGQADVLVSPNRPDRLAAGAFDGFPLTTSVEAALAGTVVIATDAYGESPFTDDEVVVIEPRVIDVVRHVFSLSGDPARLARMGIAAAAAFAGAYAPEAQIAPRLALLRDLAARPAAHTAAAR